MKIVPFEALYNTEFQINEPMSKTQDWHSRYNYYNALGRPKISHTLLWMKNCCATVRDKSGFILEVGRNQLLYTAKGTEYRIDFRDTGEGDDDTVVIHFQLTDASGEDIAPSMRPVLCLKNVESSMAMDMDNLAEEMKKNIVCMPKVKAIIYRILAAICQKQKSRATKNKYACIRTGIELLEQDSRLSIAQIAEKSGVSECYFRRLFCEYSGESPMTFRQRHRIERAKQLLLSEEHFTIGEIAYQLGFSDIYHFSKTFSKFTGLSPSAFLKKATLLK